MAYQSMIFHAAGARTIIIAMLKAILVILVAMPGPGLAQVEGATIETLPEVSIVSIRPAVRRASVPVGLHMLDLAEEGPIDWPGTLDRLPGAFILRQGPAGTRAQLGVRGLVGRHVRVEIDGVPVNDPAGLTGRASEFDASFPGSAQRVELLAGPLATLHGAEALGGSLRIVTEAAPRGPVLAFSGVAGSRGLASGLWRIDAGHVNEAGQGAGVRLVVSGQKGDGFSAARSAGLEEPRGEAREADGHRDLSYAGTLAFFPEKNAEIRLDLRQSRLVADFDAFAFSRVAYDGEGVKERDRDMAVLRFIDRRQGKNRVVTLSSLAIETRTEDDNPFACDPVTRNCISGLGERMRAAWREEWKWQTIQLAALAEMERERYQRRDSAGQETIDRRRNTVGIAVDGRIQAGKSLEFHGGLRWDGDNASKAAATWRMGAIAGPATVPVRFLANVATGFAPPSLYQRYRYPTTAQLVPERAFLWDAGLALGPREQDRGGAEIVFFRTSIKDRIGTEGSRASRRHTNQGRLRVRGVRFLLRSGAWETRLGTLRGKLSYGWTDGEAIAPSGAISPIERVPGQQGRVGLDLAFAGKRGRAELDLMLAGNHWDYFDTNRTVPNIRTGERARLDLGVSWLVTRSIKASLRVTNLFDDAGETIAGYRAVPFSIEGGLHLRLPPS